MYVKYVQIMYVYIYYVYIYIYGTHSPLDWKSCE